MSPKVLFVDDDASNLVVCEAMFGEKFDVLTASSGAEALALMRRHEVAVVVSDQRMPLMTGVELLELVRREFPDARRVLVRPTPTRTPPSTRSTGGACAAI